jgi:cytochrome c556
MTRKLVLMAAMVLAVGVLAVGGVARAEGFDPVLTRQAGQDLVLGTFAGIKAVITANGDVKTLEGPANAIRKWSIQFPTLFPAGSDKGNTKAAPTIWTDQAGFRKAAMTLTTTSEALATAAKSGDATAVAAAFKEVGEACGACHKEYRLK